MNKTVLIGIVFVLVVLAFLIYSSMHIAKYRVEVCVAFHGSEPMPHGVGRHPGSCAAERAVQCLCAAGIRRDGDHAVRARDADQRQMAGEVNNRPAKV